MTTNESHSSSLVDKAKGLIERDVFGSAELFEQEKEKIFAHTWQFVGHESQIPKTGDFFLSRLGGESVIMTRDKTGAVRVYLNSCRHRGMRVCRYDEGHTSTFYCPYHGWSYGLDGSLRIVTEEKAEYGNTSFKKEEWGLKEVAGLKIINGLVFATWDANGPDFDEWLGPAKQMLDYAFKAWDGEGEVEVLGSVIKWIIPSNWKIVAENFIGDLLHNVSHQSVDMIGIGPNGEKGRRDTPGAIVQSAYNNGHGGIYLDYREMPRNFYAECEVTAKYYQESLKRRFEVFGEGAHLTFGVGSLFPNMSFHGTQPRTVLVAHPLGVDKTEMWRWFFVDKNAPDETKKMLRKYFMRYSGPCGLTEQDDMENWNYATEAAKGVVARTLPYNYMAGLKQDSVRADIPGAQIGTPNTEGNARGYYAKWAEMMGV